MIYRRVPFFTYLESPITLILRAHDIEYLINGTRETWLQY